MCIRDRTHGFVNMMSLAVSVQRTVSALRNVHHGIVPHMVGSSSLVSRDVHRNVITVCQRLAYT